MRRQVEHQFIDSRFGRHFIECREYFRCSSGDDMRFDDFHIHLSRSRRKQFIRFVLAPHAEHPTVLEGQFEDSVPADDFLLCVGVVRNEDGKCDDEPASSIVLPESSDAFFEQPFVIGDEMGIDEMGALLSCKPR